MNNEAQDICVLEVGKPYPFPIQRGTQGAIGEFFRAGGSNVVIALPNMTSKEAALLSSEGGQRIKAGVVWKGIALMVYFDFGNGLRFETSLNTRIIPSDELSIPTQDESNERLVVAFHFVDTATGQLVGLRVATLHHQTTAELLTAAAWQQTMGYSQQAFGTAVGELTANKEVKIMMGLAEMRKMG